MAEFATATAHERVLNDEELAGVVGGISPISGSTASSSSGWWQSSYRPPAPQRNNRHVSPPPEQSPQESPAAEVRRGIDVRG